MTGLIKGGTHVDERGQMRFCNDFDMSAVKRFYTISNSMERPVRGWIGHKKETKWFFPLKGMTLIDVVPMGDQQSPTERFLLDARNPHVVKVEPGYWLSIEQGGDSEVMVFSDCKVGEYENDDFRRPL